MNMEIGGAGQTPDQIAQNTFNQMNGNTVQEQKEVVMAMAGSLSPSTMDAADIVADKVIANVDVQIAKVQAQLDQKIGKGTSLLKAIQVGGGRKGLENKLEALQQHKADLQSMKNEMSNQKGTVGGQIQRSVGGAAEAMVGFIERLGR